MIIANIADFREAARRRLPRFLFEYIDGGSYSETTLRRNVDDLAGIALRQRVLRDVSQIDLSTELFGARQAMPVALAPIGLAGLNARRGETQAVRAAEKAGVPFTLSTVSACPLNEVAAAAQRPFWFQLYMIRDRGFMRELLAQAVAAECSALVFTVDMPVPGSRYRDVRSGVTGAPGLKGDVWRTAQAMQRPGWAWDVGLWGRPHHLGNIAPALKGQTGLNDFFAWMRENFDSAVTWRDLDFIRSEWRGPLILKGILDPEDAKEAAALGADGLIVSNHGGRQLDGVLSTARAAADCRCRGRAADRDGRWRGAVWPRCGAPVGAGREGRAAGPRLGLCAGGGRRGGGFENAGADRSGDTRGHGADGRDAHRPDRAGQSCGIQSGVSTILSAPASRASNRR